MYYPLDPSLISEALAPLESARSLVRRWKNGHDWNTPQTTCKVTSTVWLVKLHENLVESEGI